jgi:hypothetical protein
LTAPPAVLPVPRPKTTKDYDQRTTEQAFQALERDLSEKYDRRSDLILDPGKELVLTADNSSAQYGIGIDNSGYLRILDYSDGTIGTFSVAWSNVDGAAQEITNLTAYVDAADATLQASINTNASSSTANGTAISVLQTEITAAREGEASLLANITDVRTAFASADAAEASARTTLQANLEAADTALQANIDAEESARVTADTAEAASRTALEVSLRGEMPRNNLIPARYQIPTEADFDADSNFALFSSASQTNTSIQNPYTNTDALRFDSSAAFGTFIFSPNIGSGAFDYATRISVLLDSGKTYAIKLHIGPDSNVTETRFIARGRDGSFNSIGSTTSTGTITENYSWSPSTSQEYSFELRIGSASGAAIWLYRVQLVEIASDESASDIPWIEQGYSDQKAIAAAVIREESARVTADTAEAAARATLEATVGTNTTSIDNIAEAYATDTTGTARLVWRVNTSTNVATIEQTAATGYDDGTWNGSAIALTANEISLRANAIDLGSDTEFEDTHDTFITETGGYRYRYGGPFGTSSDLLAWFGPASVAQNSETKTNGVFAQATDGKVYYGNAELTSPFRLTGTPTLLAEVSGSGAGTATTGAPGISALNATGSVTYEWYQVTSDGSASVSSSTAQNPTFSRAMGAAPATAVSTIWKCVATDAGSGEVAQFDVRVTFTNAF